MLAPGLRSALTRALGGLIDWQFTVGWNFDLGHLRSQHYDHFSRGGAAPAPWPMARLLLVQPISEAGLLLRFGFFGRLPFGIATREMIGAENVTQRGTLRGDVLVVFGIAQDESDRPAHFRGGMQDNGLLRESRATRWFWRPSARFVRSWSA